MARTLLTLLVLMNLTLVCQGHDEHGYHTDFHLTLLGEPDEGESTPMFEVVPSSNVPAIEGSNVGRSVSVPPQAPNVPAVAAAQEGAHALSSLAVDLSAHMNSAIVHPRSM